jgi:hypothetical protein
VADAAVPADGAAAVAAAERVLLPAAAIRRSLPVAAVVDEAAQRPASKVCLS